jgi:hypothetical protein
MSYGAQVKFGIARQTNAGSYVTDPGSFHGFAFLSEDIGLEKEELISQNLTGRFEEGAVYDGISRINGTLEFELTPRNIGAAALAVINTPSTVTSGSVKTYTFLPNTQDVDASYVKVPMTIYKQFTDASSAEHFYDCQFSELQLQFGQGAFLRGRASVAGGTRAATGIGSLNVLPPASDVGRLFPWNVTSISYGGAGLLTMSEVTIGLNENVDAIYSMNGTLAPLKFTRTAFRQVTAQGTFYMNDRSILNNFVIGTQAQLVITAVNTRAAIQSGYYDTVKVDVPQMKITAFKPGANGPGEVAVNFTARGVLDPTSAYAFQLILTNTYSAGY